MRFERLSTGEGLSQSVVNCITQDTRGFLWLGTQDGLNRYDGYEFEVYRHDDRDPSSLAHDWINALAAEPGGDLWIGTEGGGLSRWHQASDSFTSYRHDPANPRSLSGDRVAALAWDRSGSLWVGTLESGLNRLDPATGTFQRFRHDPHDPGSLAHDRVGAIHQDRAGRLWVGTWGGLDLFDPSEQRFVHYRHDPENPQGLNDGRVRALLEDQHGALWVGTHGGLHRFDPESGVFERFLHDASKSGSLSHDWVRALLEDDDGRLWVGTDGGLNLWREKNRDFVSYHPVPGDVHGLGSDQVPALYQDRTGLLWISAVGAGVRMWNPETWSFAHYLGSAGVDGKHSTVFAISEDREGRLWIGTFGDGLERLDRATGERRRFTHRPGDAGSLGDDRVTALLHDRTDALWIGTVAGGLHRKVGDRFIRYRHDPLRPDSLAVDAVTALYEDRRGRLWIGTYGGGLHHHLGEGSFVRYRHDPRDSTSLGNDRVFALAEDPQGHLWLATDGGGLNRLDTAGGTFLRLEHDPNAAGSLSSDELISVHVDAAGELWVGTKGRGLDRLIALDEETGRAVFKNYSVEDGLPGETIWGILSDASGNLWLSTHDGLSRFDPRSGVFANYDTSHGLQADEFNMGAHYRSSRGELFFGGVNGFNAFFPEDVEKRTQAPPVVLTSLTKINRPVSFDRPLADVREITLGHRDYFFSLEFAALDFTAPEKNRYRYKLEGFDPDWVDLGHDRRVTFTNLDPGRYVLRVQGANHDGAWNEEGATLTITVTPPPWRTWWAYTLYGLVAAAVIGASVRLALNKVERERAIARRERAQSEERRKLLEERERLILELEARKTELESFSYTVSHDLKNPLITIKGFLGILKRDAAAGDQARVEHDIRRIGDAADRMYELLDELLELSRLGRRAQPMQEVHLGLVAREALELVTEKSEPRPAHVVIAPDLPVIVGDRTRLLQVYENLLANALKFMGDQPSPRIDVGVTRNGTPPGTGGPVFYVRDNGIGIPPRYREKVFGLFERLDAGEDGTGMGLTLVKRIVELHGGRVWVESEGPGRGSTFCFTLGEPASSG